MSMLKGLFGGKPEKKHTTDSPDVIRQRLASGEAIMLDVRSQKEFDEGHLKNVVFVPITEIKALPEGTAELAGLDKGKIIYVH